MTVPEIPFVGGPWDGRAERFPDNTVPAHQFMVAEAARAVTLADYLDPGVGPSVLSTKLDTYAYWLIKVGRIMPGRTDEQRFWLYVDRPLHQLDWLATVTRAWANGWNVPEDAWRYSVSEVVSAPPPLPLPRPIGATQCVAPGCMGVATYRFTAHVAGWMAGREWGCGDALDFCAPHADDLYRAVYADTDHGPVHVVDDARTSWWSPRFRLSD